MYKRYRSKTEEEMFNWRVGPLAGSIRHSFSHILPSQKGVWRDQLFCHVEGHRFLSICPLNDMKYLDPDKIAGDMMSILQTVSVIEAIYTCIRPLELESGPIDTFNIIYIGPAAWDGGTYCLPYTYSQRLNEAWMYEHPFFDSVSDSINESILKQLRNNFYAVCDVSFTERNRILTSKGYRIVDSNEITKKRVSSVIATVGQTRI